MAINNLLREIFKEALNVNGRQNKNQFALIIKIKIYGSSLKLLKHKLATQNSHKSIKKFSKMFLYAIQYPIQSLFNIWKTFFFLPFHLHSLWKSSVFGHVYVCIKKIKKKKQIIKKIMFGSLKVFHWNVQIYTRFFLIWFRLLDFQPVIRVVDFE